MKSITTWVACVTVLFSVPCLGAEETDGIPKEARKALEVFVGDWKSEISEDGKSIGTSTHKRQWAEGDAGLVMTTTSSQGGVNSTAVGVAGWDAKGKQLVEHWYSSLGLSATVRYPLEGMGKDVWKGTLSVTLADGKGFDGTCELHIEPTGWTWLAHWTQDGKQMDQKNVTRQAKAE